MSNRRFSQKLLISLSIAAIGTAAFADYPESFADLAEEVSPSVVRISTTATISGQINPWAMVPEGEEIPEFLEELFSGIEGMQGEEQVESIGSGVIINDGAFIITNDHVVDGAESIVVETSEGKVIEAELIGTDKAADIAVLKVAESEENLTSVEFGDSDAARVGDWVMAIGNPLGQDFSVTTGVISGRHRSLDGAFDDFIQTDAAINQGNSGGPLFNMDGEVIGINTVILSPDGGSIGLGFSMASNSIQTIVNQIIEFGEARRGWIGVGIEDLNEEYADANGLDSTDGALISNVTPEGPADLAGIKAGDIVLSVDGTAIKNSKELVKFVGTSEVDKVVSFEVFRPLEEKNITLEIKLGKRPSEDELRASENGPIINDETYLGLTIIELNEELSKDLGIEDVTSGLVITKVDEKSAAAEHGIFYGDIILEVNQKAVATVDDFKNIVEEAKAKGRNAVMLLVSRENQHFFIALPLDETEAASEGE